MAASADISRLGSVVNAAYRPNDSALPIARASREPLSWGILMPSTYLKVNFTLVPAGGNNRLQCSRAFYLDHGSGGALPRGRTGLLL